MEVAEAQVHDTDVLGQGVGLVELGAEQEAAIRYADPSPHTFGMATPTTATD